MLNESSAGWGPLQEKDANKKTPPLHIAIVKGDEEAIAQCLIEGCDINESDNTGATPLHLAIQYNNYQLFSALLEKGALTKLFADGCTPLHLAVQHDFNGHFVEDLIKAGANVSIKSDEYSGLSSLDYAIERKNIKALELLLEAKANVNYKNRKSLDSDSTFASIQHLLPKRLSELEDFDTIINYIKEGDCVLLAYPGKSWGHKFKNPIQLKEDGKLIRVNVNPETRLLDDDNYEEIKDMSGCEENLEVRDMDKQPHSELRFGY